MTIQPIPSQPTPGAASPAKQAPEPGPRDEFVRFRYNPQDPLAMTGGETLLPREAVTAPLEGPRIKVSDGTLEGPDAQGNYLFEDGTRGFQQATSFVSATRTLNLVERALGHKVEWAWSFGDQLTVRPHYGEGFNAFYSRQMHSVAFFDGHDPVRNKTVHSCESLEVVSHEAGHAILDGMKPGLVGWFGSVEAEAFHESFGDVLAFLVTLQDDRVLDGLVQATGGDLRRENFVARMGEELSQGINHARLGSRKPPEWTIRNANNALRYEDPSGLPERPDDDTKLGREPHNFSRLFTGATWDVLAGLTAENRAAGQDPRRAIASARDTLLPLFLRGVELGPDRMKHYNQMAEALLRADARDNDGRHAELIARLFVARDILPGPPAAVPDLQVDRVPVLAAEAQSLLEDHRDTLGIPAGLPLEARAITRNDRGETLIRFGYAEERDLGNGLSTELGGTLTLGFDAGGRLFHRLFEPVDDEQVELAREAVEMHMAAGDIRGSAPLSAEEAVQPEGRTYTGYLEPGLDGTTRVVRLPAVN